MSKIEPRTLKGFRDFLPADMRIRIPVFQAFRESFEKYGYEPLETPTLEYADILMGKYGEEAENLIYHFRDRGNREVAMRYDVTVPACRVFAQHRNDLPIPFKRYQIQPVWRADNTQKGRFREFYQCDADTFGSSSLLAEAEFIALGVEVLQKLGFEHFVVRINNRKIIDGIAKYAGASEDQFYTICIAIDKLDKIGREGVEAELRAKSIPDATIGRIRNMLDLAEETEVLDQLETLLADFPGALEGIEELRELFELLRSLDVPEKYYRFDVTIIRGLSYYTGPVWEFEITDGGVGSVGGGGRYDKLVGIYLGQDMPAAGGSFGIERIIELIKERNLLPTHDDRRILVTVSSRELLAHSLAIARLVRNAGFATTVYPEPARLDRQFKYADRKRFPYVLVSGEVEQKNGTVRIKNMTTGTEHTVPVSDVITTLHASVHASV
ncbi:MAG: histidine--tRNA ligase [Patescibacteria group bacterium]|nr:histidine--tRNA ligase [Patescibacteria group bacterium]